MSLLNIIQNEKAIGGLEIADDGFRFSRLTKDKTGLKVELLFEEKITEADALAGEVAITAKLVKFIKQHKLEYVIVSIPANQVFVKTYDFSANMTSVKINDAMNLNVELQLPKKKTEIYCDWITIDNTDNKKVLLAYVLRDYVKSLVQKIKDTNLKIVAIESHQLSLARALKQNKDEMTLVIERGVNFISFYLIKNNNLFFSQSLPNEIIGKNLNKEVEKIINFQDYQGVTINKTILIGPFTEVEIKKLPLKVSAIELIDELKQVQNTKWIVTLGAALRGLIPRKDDKLISLMEIDTEKAYSHEKANSTVSFLTGISIALSIFFVGIFFATWNIILVMQNNYNKRILDFNLLSSSENSTSLRDDAGSFNDLIGQTSSLIKQEMAWSQIVREIKGKTTSNLVISNVYLNSVSREVSMTGMATNREAINVLKSSFESSSLFELVNIPLNNLEKKADIPFSMTFKIKI